MVSLDTHGASDSAVEAFFAQIADLEQLLSRFRPSSEISQVARGDLRPDEASPATREVLTRCAELRATTRGCFDHEPLRGTGDPADPVLDTDAFAKGWIIQQAAVGLAISGTTSFFASAGGDVVVGGAPPDRRGWRVGIQHPENPTAVLAVLELTDAAVATSGAYERGGHIRVTSSSLPTSSGLTSVTVVGSELGVADALATAVYASDHPFPDWWSDVGPYELLTASTDGRLRWTSGLDEFLVEPLGSLL